MALHPNFPKSPYEILDPAVRWFPVGDTLPETEWASGCHRAPWRRKLAIKVVDIFEIDTMTIVEVTV